MIIVSLGYNYIAVLEGPYITTLPAFCTHISCSSLLLIFFLLFRIPKGRDNSEDLCRDEEIILEWILDK
jgi:hypothetical protein